VFSWESLFGVNGKWRKGKPGAMSGGAAGMDRTVKPGDDFFRYVNGNWSQLDMTSELGASTTEAALALTAFWGMVTVGRASRTVSYCAARTAYAKYL
jgi:hypothetical protein